MADLATTEAESRHCGVTPRPRGQRGEAEVVQLGAQRGPRPRGRAPAGAGPSEAGRGEAVLSAVGRAAGWTHLPGSSTSAASL